MSDQYRGMRRGRGIALVLACVALGACAPTISQAPRDELAKLRAEHRELQLELERLRREVAELSGVPGAEVAVDAQPAAQVEPPSLDIEAARAGIVQALETYRESLESKDLELLERNVYRSGLPRSDAELFTAIFERTDDLDVRIEARDIRIQDGSARVLVGQTMDYKLRRTHEPRQIRIVLIMLFERDRDEWRLTQVSRR